MKASIEVFCRDYSNIVLISHSMGGLISKSYILSELEESERTKVKLFFSLAVPHKGSSWANLGKKLTMKNPQVVDLQPVSDFLDQFNYDWVKQKLRLPKTVYYYGQYDEIVNEKSAVSIQVENPIKVACNNDHFDITRPESTNSIVYKSIENYLVDFVKEEKFKNEMEHKEFNDDGRFDNEIFVLKLLIADVHNQLISDSKELFLKLNT